MVEYVEDHSVIRKMFSSVECKLEYVEEHTDMRIRKNTQKEAERL